MLGWLLLDSMLFFAPSFSHLICCFGYFLEMGKVYLGWQMFLVILINIMIIYAIVCCPQVQGTGTFICILNCNCIYTNSILFCIFSCFIGDSGPQWHHQWEISSLISPDCNKLWYQYQYLFIYFLCFAIIPNLWCYTCIFIVFLLDGQLFFPHMLTQVNI